MSHWIEQAEAALQGEPNPDVDVLRGERPALFDSHASRVLVSGTMAAFMWSAVVFRQLREPSLLDSVALLLRLLAIALTTRALIALWQWLQRVRLWLAAPRYALALAADGLLLRLPSNDVAVPREDVVAVLEQSAWHEQKKRMQSDVYVVTRPSTGRLYVSIPPVLDHNPAALAERLMRWRGPASERTHVASTPNELPSRLFERVAAGETPEGTTVVREGTGWLRRGPFATVLLGVALLMSFLRGDPVARAHVGTSFPLMLAVTMLVVPIAWVWLTKRSRSYTRGLAMLLTSNELLIRSRAGVQRWPWAEMTRTDVRTRRGWSLVFGQYESRSVLLQRKNGESLGYSEELLAAPSEVVVALCEAHRKHILP